jgi:hypothetical protein
VTTTAAAAGTRCYTASYPAEPVQVKQVRSALAALLRDCPRADDAILVASEYATNSIVFCVHSASRGGGEFTFRAEVQQTRLRIEWKMPAARGPVARTMTAAGTDSTSWPPLLASRTTYSGPRFGTSDVAFGASQKMIPTPTSTPKAETPKPSSPTSPHTPDTLRSP